MAYCGNCGKELVSGTKFCTNCGAAVNGYNAENIDQKRMADDLIQDTFGKALASAICASFPVASIVAIFLGNSALDNWKHATALAKQYGFTLTGKNIPVRVLGLVGKIAGIVMPAFWGIYFLILLAMVIAGIAYGI